MKAERWPMASVSLLPMIAALLAACSPRTGSLPAEVTSELENAFTRGDVQACVDVYTDDAEIIPEDSPVVRGKRALREFFQDQVAREISFDTDSTLSLVQGNLAIDQGTYRVRNVKLGEDVEYGEYLNVWRNQGGRWRTYRTMINVTMTRRAGISVAPDEEPDSTPPPLSSVPRLGRPPH